MCQAPRRDRVVQANWRADPPRWSRERGVRDGLPDPWGLFMKRRFVLPGLLATLAIVAAVAAGGSSGATSKAADKTLSVWLQIDAQSGWSDLVAATNAKFQSDHPGVNVNVQYQTWPT